MTEVTTTQLWIAPSLTPYGNEGSAYAIVAAGTPEKAQAKIKAAVAERLEGEKYVPRVERLHDINTNAIRPIEGVFIEDGLR